MPRTDVPLPGQGKRSQRKAWRDNADRAIAIYSLSAEEIPEATTEESMSQALPFWDDARPQQQSQTHSNIYMEEEAQELVEKAYQEGWQQGMEEGYKLGKEKGYKEYKVQEKEEAAKEVEEQANEVTVVCQGTQDAPRSISSINTTTQMDLAVPEV
jgi:flagellar biosynthesis/type III secretory pathway protein FliH